MKQRTLGKDLTVSAVSLVFYDIFISFNFSEYTISKREEKYAVITEYAKSQVLRDLAFSPMTPSIWETNRKHPISALSGVAYSSIRFTCSTRRAGSTTTGQTEKEPWLSKRHI